MKKISVIGCLGIIILFIVIYLQSIVSKRVLNNAKVRTPENNDIPFSRIAAVGDILCPNQNLGKPCQEDGIAKLIKDINPQAILIPGDSQYEKGTYSEYEKYFESFLGKYKKIIYPSTGNHDYYTPNASGYYDYFNGIGKSDGVAGQRDKGYYSFEIGNWHIISLNSNCLEIGGCGKDSVQEKWLLSDLQKNKQLCILTYWHEPLFSSGPHGNNLNLRDIWKDLYAYKADIVLNGHDHDFERFKKQDAYGNEDEKGIREFVIGTGGQLLYRFISNASNSEVRDASSHGVLELKLYKDKYEWNFLPVEGDIFKDTGSSACNLKN
jgi:hypothetical protein